MMARPSPTRSRRFMVAAVILGLAVMAMVITAAIAATTATVSSSKSPEGVLAAAASVAKILVEADGPIAITAADLQSLGWGTLDPARLRLTRNGQAQPLWIVGQGSSLQLRFYGQLGQSQYSREGVYLLQLAGDPALSMTETLLPSPTALTAIDHYTAMLHAEENTLYAPQVTDGDHWFWADLPAPRSKTFTVTLTSVAAGPGQVRLAVWGSTDSNKTPNHHLRLSVNGQVVADEKWGGIGRRMIEATVPAGLLINGDTQIRVEAPGDTGVPVDTTRVDWIEVRFPRLLVAQDDRLMFDSSGGSYTLSGFSGPIAVFDVTQPDRVTRLSGLTGTDQNPIVDGEAGHRYLAVGPQGYRSARVVRAALQPDLRAANLGADYVAIGTPDFLEPLKPLLDWRQTQGLKTLAVPIDAIYDQFNFGVPDPEAIRSFLQYATKSWSSAPKYVLLAGGTTYDRFAYTVPPTANRVPTFFIQTAYGGETASDVGFAQLNGEAAPSIAIGRMPARDPNQIKVLVKKILDYEGAAPDGDWKQRVVAVADGQDASFKAEAQTFIDRFGAPYQTRLINPAAGATDAVQQVLGDLNAGSLLVAYFGHGSITQWGKDNIFTVNDVAALKNGGRLPVVINMTCLTGLFTHPKIDSLADTLLWKEEGGAVAVLAPTSLTLPADQSFLSNALVTAYLADPTKPIGDLVLSAWRTVATDSPNSQDVLRTFLLFGDPALRLTR